MELVAEMGGAGYPGQGAAAQEDMGMRRFIISVRRLYNGLTDITPPKGALGGLKTPMVCPPGSRIIGLS